ncbi:ABC transporter permease [Marinomonas pollencensis]|uniref:Peptide/nickel transport system permease protein n=1 Tax=Marinomonas pollencensis TaxID=491954 RepID=A0A3E0DRG3_9GAMM|nr:ABC transporter permease [Marinomonas pollencensis]REG84932.1 peptide/nickel transport system permease protein [Marinomonas pollencensis]
MMSGFTTKGGFLTVFGRAMHVQKLRPLLHFISMLAMTLFGLLLLTFVIGRLMPTDPVIAVIGDKAPEALYQKTYLEMGLDKPIVTQFGYYLNSVFHGDLGTSVRTANPVTEDILNYFPATLELATLAIIFGVLFGVPIGVLAAVKQNKWPDNLVRVFALIGHSSPIFWLAMLAIVVFYQHLDWVAAPEGRLSVMYEYTLPKVTNMVLIDTLLAGDWGAFKDAFAHIVLPASLLSYYSVAYLSRMTRSFMLDQLQQEYITTARVKGVSERAIIWKHALGNAWVPLITVIALSYASLLEGSVLTEIVFSWPGLGRYITDSLLAADMNAVLGGTIVVGFVFILLNLTSDLLYKIFDPRAK